MAIRPSTNPQIYPMKLTRLFTEGVDDQFYEQAAEEIQSRNIRRGVMARALVDADGNKDRAISLYIKRRVQQLTQEAEQGAKQAAEIKAKTDEEENWHKTTDKNLNRSTCKKCGFKGEMDMPFWQFGHDLKCPKCGYEFEWHYDPSIPKPEANTPEERFNAGL